MDLTKYTYRGKFDANILVLGQTACGKTTFVQNLGENKVFEKIVSWVTKIVLSKEREQNIRLCFDVSLEFFYPQNIGKFDVIIENFQMQKKHDSDSIFGENNVFNRLIVMDDISGIADRSSECRSFFTVARKFNFTCVSVFHTMYPSKLNWQMIISQTKIFNIFPSSIQIASISKILSANCNRYTFDYIPNRDLWVNRLYFEISNFGRKDCLTIDCHNIGPSKYRASTESDTCQICYYNRNKKYKLFNRIFSERKQCKQCAGEDIAFEIKSKIEETNEGDINYYEVTNELDELKNGFSNDYRRNSK